MFNGITLELIWRRLISSVDEAAAALVRTSFSSVVRESNDFACVITDAQGNSIAQASGSIPSFIGTSPRTIRVFLGLHRLSDIHPGDVFITNDIWHGTGHLPDITVAKPIFCGETLVAWAGSVAHAPDIGGRVRSADAPSVFEEGLQIPPLKVMSRGEPDRTLLAILRANVRVPDQVTGDLYAQFNALEVIERKVLALMREHRLESLTELSQVLRQRSETAMRRAIAAIPDGSYHAEAVSDGLDQRIQLQMSLRVKGDEIEIDFAGSHAQVPRSINVCLAYTTAYTSFGVKAILCPDTPNNDGALAPLKITAPAGSILNSQHPAAGGARALIGHFLPAMVMQALAEVMPQRVIAGVGSPLWCVNTAGVTQGGRPYTGLFFLNGGYGASATRDGCNVLSWPSNISSTPVEIIEQLTPLKVHSRRLRVTAQANGRFRGGLGQELVLESRSPEPVTMSFMAERTTPESAAPGLLGGSSGESGEILIDGEPVDPKRQHLVQPGVLVTLRTPGGGGYGPAGERGAAGLEADRVNGYVA